MKHTSSKVNRVDDQQLISDLSTNVFGRSLRQKPIIIAFFYYIFSYLIGVFAYIPRALLRTKLGVRTFGIATLIGVFFLVWSVGALIKFTPQIIQDVREVATDMGYNASDISSGDALTAVVMMSVVAAQEQSVESTVLGGTWLYFREHFSFDDTFNSEGIFLFGLILLLAVFHWLEIQSRRKGKEVIHSYYRGDSVFFGNTVGEKIFGWQVSSLFVWMVLDPLLIILVAYLLQYGLRLELIPLILKVGAFFLIIEEINIYRENKQMVLDIIDSQIDAVKIMEIQDQYAQVPTVGNTQKDSTESISLGKVLS